MGDCLVMADDGLPLLVDDEPPEPVTLEETIDEIRAAREERLDQLDPPRRVITVDSSVLVPALRQSHPAHDVARAALSQPDLRWSPPRIIFVII
jgi:hypothetical protein